MLRLHLVALQTCQRTQPHVHDGLCLPVIQPKPLGQAVLCLLHGLAAADDADHLIDVIQGNEQTLQQVISLLRLVQVVLRPSGDHFLLMLQVVGQHFLQVQDFGLVADERNHVDTKGVLHLRVLEELVQDDICVRIVPQLDDNPHAFPVRLIAQVRDALDALVLDEVRNRADQVRLVDKVR